MARGKAKAKSKKGNKPKAKARSEAKPKVVDEALTKGELRKLNALRKSLGDQIAEEAFAKWKAQKADGPVADPTAERIAGALDPIVGELRFPRGSSYVVRRGRGRVIVELVDG